jgi:DNA repair exonuclease SbcCD nuclease subunit
MFQFIHAADIHLDSPLTGLARFDGAPIEKIRSATREAFRSLVDLAIDEQVAFVLISGDLWDGDWPDAGPGLFFISEVRRLAKADIPLLVIKGNHDAQSQMTNAIRNWPSNVTMFGHKKPQTVKLEKWNVAIHGQSYGQQHVMEDLSVAYPMPIPGAFNIGMLHTCLDDGGTEYAPACLDRLIAHGYDYWALGHIHDRRDFSRDRVHVEYPGNLQGRSMRETGPKGCTVVTVADDGSVGTRFEALDVVRWMELRVEAEDSDLELKARGALETAALVNPDRLLAVRLRIVGNVRQGQALRDRMDAVAVEVGDVWIERVVIEPNSSSQADSRGKPLALDEELRQVLLEFDKEPNPFENWIPDVTRLRTHFGGDSIMVEAVMVLHDAEALRTFVARIGEELSCN